MGDRGIGGPLNKGSLLTANSHLIGIEMKFKNQNYPILIAPTHIPELNAVEHTEEGIRFGASVTLTTLEEVLTEACHSMPGTNVTHTFRD